MNLQTPIVIKKERAAAHKSHHGGAWKVAYADFVTALMAFFLVMWLVNASPSVRAAVAMYFRDPGVFEVESRTGGLLPGAQSGLRDDEGADNNDLSAARGMLTRTTHGAIDQIARKPLDETARELKDALYSNPRFAELKEYVEIEITPEGLRLELLETSDTSFFEIGSARPREDTVALLAFVGGELGTLPNAVAIEGHTDSRQYGRGLTYGNWELSTDRANAARRVMEGAGLDGAQIEVVGGYADTRLRYPDQPFDARNRRISIVVRDSVPRRR